MVENLRTLLEGLALAGTAAWIAVGVLSLLLWWRDRQADWAKLAGGFLLLGLNQPIGLLVSWALTPLYQYFSTEVDPLGGAALLLDGIVTSAFALTAVIIIGMGVAGLGRRLGNGALGPTATAVDSPRRGRRGR